MEHKKDTEVENVLLRDRVTSETFFFLVDFLLLLDIETGASRMFDKYSATKPHSQSHKAAQSNRNFTVLDVWLQFCYIASKAQGRGVVWGLFTASHYNFQTLHTDIL